MKSLITALLMLTGSMVFAQSRSIQNLVGKWEAVRSDNKGVGLEVIDSTKIFLAYGTEKKQLVNYSADFTKTPAWFDFTVKDSIQEIAVKSLLYFVNDDTVQWQLFDGETRPLIFTADRGEMIFLKRRK